MIPIYSEKAQTHTVPSLCLRAGENAGEVNAFILLSVSVCRPGGLTARRQPFLTRFQLGDVLQEPPPAKLTAKTLQMW